MATSETSRLELDPEKAYLPGEARSLSGIATRAFSLGFAQAIGISSTFAILLLTSSPLWRLPFLLSTLSLFHFLEFWTQARYNTREAGTMHFLLSANGVGYAGAHAASLVECLFTNMLLPSHSLHAWIGPSSNIVLTLLGVATVVMGQTVRSVAMVQAGKSFNHHVQETKKASHVLVTTGLYGTFRHPSYFGFFWWVLGIQLVMGNVFCLLVYVLVLHRYYSNRIAYEESFLVKFFGNEYVDYRKRVGTKIPFVP
ncbi:farnesyl cysteine-carboxyl methyltransferase [Gnomoniopsis smithogilvyi]|uniref:Protein-S-isoprenylcysteine O-methyltransferase n=1 Tax=Gnomoniopsis smithogilvyi TaxID=1191159 RepID=A0A9W9CZD6_9PEZI|nr:farnesyl cysteine-carboxyl methyltransferase [Gnomoniopsis smithogilvyi]